MNQEEKILLSQKRHKKRRLNFLNKNVWKMKSRDFENFKAKEAKLYILIANDMNKALRSIYFIVHVL